MERMARTGVQITSVRIKGSGDFKRGEQRVARLMVLSVVLICLPSHLLWTMGQADLTASLVL